MILWWTNSFNWKETIKKVWDVASKLLIIELYNIVEVGSDGYHNLRILASHYVKNIWDKRIVITIHVVIMWKRLSIDSQENKDLLYVYVYNICIQNWNNHLFKAYLHESWITRIIGFRLKRSIRLNPCQYPSHSREEFVHSRERWKIEFKNATEAHSTECRLNPSMILSSLHRGLALETSHSWNLSKCGYSTRWQPLLHTLSKVYMAPLPSL